MNNSRVEITKELALEKINDKYSNLKDFITKVDPYYIEVKEDTKEIVFDEINYNKRQFMILVPEKQTKKSKTIFRDDLTDYVRIHENYLVDFEILESNYNKLLESIKSLGCSLCNFASGNDFYNWYDLIIPIDIFTEELLSKCVELWNEYNKELDKYIV